MRPQNKTIISTPDIDQYLRSEIAEWSEVDGNLWSSPKKHSKDYAHSLFQYPAMMVPSVQRKLIGLIHQARPDINTMLDPFVGAGTTIAASMSCGLDCYGQDINPLAVLISKAKTDLGWADQDLRQTCKDVVAQAEGDGSTKIDVDFTNITKWFSSSATVELSKLRRAIKNQSDQRIRRILWVILAETIRLTSNDRTTTYKLHARPIDEIKIRVVSPLGTYKGLVNQCVEDIILYKKVLLESGYIEEDKYKGHVEIRLGDSTKSMPSPEAKKSFDLLVTSPPYGDNTSTITYGQHAYLPLQWIDLSDIGPGVEASFLRTTQEIDRRSLGGKSPKQLKEMQTKLSDESDSLIKVFSSLSDKPPDRTSRVASFYNDFIDSIDKIIPTLAGNTYMVWTLGNRRVGGIEIPNDVILGEILSSRNVKFVTDVKRTIHFKRMPNKNKIAQTMRTEKILVFKKLPQQDGIQ